MSILNSAMLSLQKPREMAIIAVLHLVTRQTLVILLVALLRSLHGLVIAWVISTIFCFRPETFHAVLFPPFMQDMLNFICNWYDRVCSQHASLSQVGTYYSAMTAFGLLVGLPKSIGSVLLPAYASPQGKSGVHSLENTIKITSRWGALLLCARASVVHESGSPRP